MERSILMNKTLSVDTPEAVGISSRHIESYLKRLREIDYDLHSFQICKDDRIVFSRAAEPYTLESPHRLLSAAKAIIAAAVLFAVDEGALTLESNIVDYFADKLPDDPDERFKRITVYHLLTMQSGQDTDEAFLHFLEDPEDDLCSNFFRAPMTCEPGTHFFYNNSIPHLLFSLVERATGRDIEAYIKEKICDPLEMDIIAQYNNCHVYDPVTTVVTANGFLKLALWFLKRGEWNGKQLIDPSLIRMACTQQVWTGEPSGGYHNGKGYCMQLWKNAFGGCRMDGGGGQIALILPEENMAVTIMGNESRGDLAIQFFYEEILSKISGRALKEDREGESALEEAAANMSRAPYGVKAHEAAEKWIEGKIWRFHPNKWGVRGLAFEFGACDHVQVEMEAGFCKYSIGLEACWGKNASHFILEPDISIQNRIYGPDPEQCCLSGGWSDDKTFVVVCKSAASMGEYRFKFVFCQDKLKLYLPNGISAGMKQEPGWSCLESV